MNIDEDNISSLNLSLRSGVTLEGPTLDTQHTPQRNNPDEITAEDKMAAAARALEAPANISQEMIVALDGAPSLSWSDMDQLSRTDIQQHIPERLTRIQQHDNIPSCQFIKSVWMNINAFQLRQVFIQIDRSDLADIIRYHTCQQAPVDDSTTTDVPKVCVPRGKRLDQLDDYQLKNAISLKLSIIRPDGNDVMGLGSLLGVGDDIMANIRQSEPPSSRGMLLLDHWKIERDATMGTLHRHLLTLCRTDITDLFQLTD